MLIADVKHFKTLISSVQKFKDFSSRSPIDNMTIGSISAVRNAFTNTVVKSFLQQLCTKTTQTKGGFEFCEEKTIIFIDNNIAEDTAEKQMQVKWAINWLALHHRRSMQWNTTFQDSLVMK